MHAPDLQQRQRRRAIRRRIEIRGAVGGEPGIGVRERDDAAELVPDARLGRPLRPRVPRIERLPRDLEAEQHEAQRDPREQQPPAERARPREPGRIDERAQRAAKRAPRTRRRRDATRRRPAADGNREQRRADRDRRRNATPASDNARIHSVSRNAPTR